MELKEFVSRTLEDILAGVNDAQKNITGTHVGTVAPAIPVAVDGKLSYPERVNDIHFEIAVGVEEKSGSNASISVISAIVNGKLMGNSSSGNLEHSKISFSVPVYFSHRSFES